MNVDKIHIIIQDENGKELVSASIQKKFANNIEVFNHALYRLKGEYIRLVAEGLETRKLLNVDKLGEAIAQLHEIHPDNADKAEEQLNNLLDRIGRLEESHQDTKIKFKKSVAEAIELAENQVASEKLGGNIVKENYWQGELNAFRRIQHYDS